MCQLMLESNSSIAVTLSAFFTSHLRHSSSFRRPEIKNLAQFKTKKDGKTLKIEPTSFEMNRSSRSFFRCKIYQNNNLAVFTSNSGPHLVPIRLQVRPGLSFRTLPRKERLSVECQNLRCDTQIKVCSLKVEKYSSQTMITSFPLEHYPKNPYFEPN